MPVCKKRNTKEKMCHVLLKPPLARFPLCTLRIALPGASLTFTVVSEANFERIKGNWATQGLVPIVAPCQDCPYLHILSFFLINWKWSWLIKIWRQELDAFWFPVLVPFYAYQDRITHHLDPSVPAFGGGSQFCATLSSDFINFNFKLWVTEDSFVMICEFLWPNRGY